MAPQQPLLTEKYDAENKGKCKRRVGQDAQCNVKRKNRPAQFRLRKAVRRGKVRCKEENQDERQDKRSDGALRVIELQSQVRQRQEPSEQRHRAIQIVIWHGMQT